MAILASVAAYAYSGFSNNAKVSEASRLLDGAQTAIVSAYQSTGTAPGNAGEAGVSQSGGKYVQTISVGGAGVVSATFNAVDPTLSGLVLSITPYTVTADPTSPIVWACGYAGPQTGWTALAPDAAGNGNPAPATTVPPSMLPRSCRAGG